MTRQLFTTFIQSVFVLVVAQLLSLNFMVCATNSSSGVSEAEIQILNCALHIEHLEDALYTEGLSRFSVQDFVNNGLEPWMYGRLQEILEHEEAHMEFLKSVVSEAGGKPVERCVYNFSYSDPRSFVEVASKLETIGTAAYHGASAMLTDERYISASGAMFAIEARHSGWVDSSVRKVSAWSGAFGVPLNCGQVLTLISPYIESCPFQNSDNSLLPEPYPPLTISSSAHPNEIASLTFTYPENHTSASLSANFLTSNAGMLFAPVIVQEDQGPAQVKIPENVRGDVFVVITTTDADHGLDKVIVAGPALIRFGFDAEGRLG
ncbi:ferritin-like domain-containing protein [Lentinula lateritia]|uniref:Ferritin-like domain-containing protein n=1 Tax=Lentinula lateritia TaxID=40482 RepID=A0ABQ8VKF3_9AGAR|nr:ferritin-like domain-containing protein [Lentinula lateritia]